MTVVSVDLAYRRYRDIGVCVLAADRNGIVDASFVQLGAAEQEAPTPERVADHCMALCNEVGATVLLLDGPQGWKDPNNGLAHARACEGALNTPGKTGLPGFTKPGNYGAFIRFSIAVYDCLHNAGWERLPGTDTRALRRPVAVESFPLSAWRTLRLAPLPSKAKARVTDVEAGLRSLSGMFRLRVQGSPNHDELQALVAGMGGVALDRNDSLGYRLNGLPPHRRDGTWREGYIINPERPAVRSVGAT